MGKSFYFTQFSRKQKDTAAAVSFTLFYRYFIFRQQPAGQNTNITAQYPAVAAMPQAAQQIVESCHSYRLDSSIIFLAFACQFK